MAAEPWTGELGVRGDRGSVESQQEHHMEQLVRLQEEGRPRHQWPPVLPGQARSERTAAAGMAPLVAGCMEHACCGGGC